MRVTCPTAEYLRGSSFLLVPLIWPRHWMNARFAFAFHNTADSDQGQYFDVWPSDFVAAALLTGVRRQIPDLYGDFMVRPAVNTNVHPAQKCESTTWTSSGCVHVNCLLKR